jgi:hypothetical protein
MSRTRSFTLPALLLALSAAACEPKPLTAPPPPAPPPGPPPAATTATPVAAPAPLSRADWNRVAAELALPLFWTADTNASSAVDPDELVVLWGMDSGSREDWVKAGAWTDKAKAAAASIEKVAREGHPTAGLSEAELKRRAAVRAELAQGRPSAVLSDFTKASEEERTVVKLVLEAARLVERLYQKQTGSFGLADKIPADDTASRMLFQRNQGPYCEAPLTENDPACLALSPKPAKLSGLYPKALQEKDAAFCKTLEASKDAKTLLSPFVVVGEEGGKLSAVPYTTHWKAEMTEVSRLLQSAADALKSPAEAPFKAYLTAASKAFLDNKWEPADEAWAKMGVTNSKYYLRIGPDETYFEPCSQKAGFHASFARINQDSLTWQNKLDPLKNEMEGALAKLAGAPYKERKVSFHLPDFIDIIVNAGDSRDSRGGTIGQSLPNWGPVANEGRGRTVAMTNLYADKDSLDALASQASSLFCKATMASWNGDPGVGVMSTVLHEAAHNLGPSHEYKVNGKKDREVFGGSLASMLEELKAQTSALFYADWLAGKGTIDKKLAQEAHIRDIAWGFGHIAQGVYTADGKPRPYSQLASIQMGYFMSVGGLVWREGEKANNGKDTGCFEVSQDKLSVAILDLEKRVLMIKGKGDKADAEKLIAEFVDKDDAWKKARAVITERWLRVPKPSFVYGVKM